MSQTKSWRTLVADRMGQERMRVLMEKVRGSSKEEWKKEELEPLAFWSKQLLGILLGVLLSSLRVGALAGFSCAAGAVLLLSRWMRSALQVPDDIMSDNELSSEGLGPAFQTFLVAWIMSYTWAYQG